MFLKILRYSAKNIKKIIEFLRNNPEFKFNNDYNSYLINIISIQILNKKYLRTEFSFSHNFRKENLNLFFSLKSNLLFFEVDINMYSLYYKFLKIFEQYLHKENLDIHFKNLIPNRNEIWKFIESSAQILNLEIITEKGLIEISEESLKEIPKIVQNIREYPVSWAQLVYQSNDLRFQYHYYVNELNIPDYIDKNKLSDFFNFYETTIH